MDAQQGPAKPTYTPHKVSNVKELVEVLTKYPTLEWNEVYVRLPDGSYREVEMVSDSDDTFVLHLGRLPAEPYYHEE